MRGFRLDSANVEVRYSKASLPDLLSSTLLSTTDRLWNSEQRWALLAVRKQQQKLVTVVWALWWWV